MQVSEKEREALLQNNRKELVNIVSSKLVHPETNRLFPPKIIEEAILSLGFDVKMNDSAKKQANYLIKELSNKYILKKADMEIKVSIREEWINEGETAGAEIQPTVQFTGEHDDDDDELHHHEEKKPVQQPKPVVEKKDGGKSHGKKKQRKNSDELFEWDKKEKEQANPKSDVQSKNIGRILLN